MVLFTELPRRSVLGNWASGIPNSRTLAYRSRQLVTALGTNPIGVPGSGRGERPRSIIGT